jgi:Predicted transcriptional regulators
MGTAEFKTVLKKLRVERGWTQKDLGIRLGASKTAVASWEQGARIPKLDKLEEIARLFNVDVNYLIGENQEKDYSRFRRSDTNEYAVLIEMLMFSNHQLSNFDGVFKVYIDGEWIPISDENVRFLENLSTDFCSTLGELAAKLVKKDGEK